MTRTFCIVVIAVCAMGIPEGRAQAPAAPPGEAARDRELERLNDLGKKYVLEGKYDEAIRTYEAAYRLDPQPIFLFNMAQSYRKKGDCQEATARYRLYLKQETDPEAPYRMQATGSIQDCRASLLKLSPAYRLEQSGRPLRTAGIALMGTGGGLLVIGGILLGAAALSAVGTGFSCIFGGGGCVQTRTDTEILFVSSMVSLSLGGAALITGIPLVAVGQTRMRKARRMQATSLSLVPLIDHHGLSGGNVALGLRF